ncbi:hypothetical protein GPECTOR_1g479 [Gonium pectorale]|uniref:Protein arginine N-methyltransferase n=1 Tax=Gonium pectorale TaxID=33097 RepID=A0A150H3C9_GONPE|nr:hypothetical protein GPECTOR_1g479 [Gonium pectorale]|eukprot:KXZ56533.1 hypothetical protein GPECTOR_1g479 [Gonium pectorale]
MVLGKRTDYGDAKFAGAQVPFTENVPATVDAYGLCGFDFVVAPLVRDTWRPPAPAVPENGALPSPLNRDDCLYINSSQWANQVVGHVSGWIQPDSPDPAVRQQGVSALRHQLGWAAHLGLQAVLLPAPVDATACHNYAQVLYQALQGLTHMALWLTVPLLMPAPGGQGTQGAAAPAAPGADGASPVAPGFLDGWEAWHQVVLTGEALHTPPPSATPQAAPFPAAPAGAAAAAAAAAKKPAPALAPGASAATALGPNGEVLGFTVTDPGESHPLRPYWEYLCFVFRRLEVVSEQERQEASYRDYLQVPLQPLQDNLESQTYETFEKDTQKYTLYEEAVYRALRDRHAPKPSAASGNLPASSILDADDPPSTSGRGAAAAGGTGGRPVVLMVVGAGRGPLVRASMKAAARAGVVLRVYAVEKNPNAIVHIQNMLRTEGWERHVSIVSADMRHWQAPEPADILVSELLGSFGDNELSPECLDGAQRFLAPGGISIPSSYTSFLAPATSHKLHHDVRSYKDLEHMETPYVVRLHRHYLLSPTQPLFTFTHPNTDQPIDNSRYATLTFARDPAAGSAVLHGFAGYFECTLYGDVLLSIHPPSHSDNMFSWFPIFFPLREPVHVPAGGSVGLAMWRCCAAHKVWYEWALTAPSSGPIHNVGGRSYWVGL